MKRKLRNLALGIFLLFGFGIMGTNQSHAQLPSLGENFASAGIGIGAFYTRGLGSSSAISNAIPPIMVAFEHILKDDIGPGVLGVGGRAGYSSYSWKTDFIGGSYGWKYTIIEIGAMGQYHFDVIDGLDPYLGLILGFRSFSSKETGTSPLIGAPSATSSGVILDGFAGTRYFFTDNLAAYGELGFGIAWLRIGVSLKVGE